MTGVNPARFSDAIIEQLRLLIPKYVPKGMLVFDPFAGDGCKLSALCRDLHREFQGNDLEDWEGRHARVRIADSTRKASYPRREYAIVTSPTYNNGVNDGFTRGDGTRGITYTFAAGHQLHPNNTGRWSGRSSDNAERRYWELHEQAVAFWTCQTAIVNVKDSVRKHQTYPLVNLWTGLLAWSGFQVVQDVQVDTPGNRYGSNRDARIDFEVILVAQRQ